MKVASTECSSYRSQCAASKKNGVKFADERSLFYTFNLFFFFIRSLESPSNWPENVGGDRVRKKK
jgi:hypothetical protein